VISRSGPSLPPKSLNKRMKTAMAHCKRIVFGDHPSNEGPKFRGVILGFIRAQAASQPSKPLEVSFIVGGSQSISEAEFWESCYPHPSQNTHRCISIHVFSNRSNDLMLAIRSIASHKFQLPTIDIVLYNLPLRTGDVLGPLYACTAINVTVYFSVHQMTHENDRCYELASWLEFFFFVHPGFSSAKCKVRLVDIPTLITPDDELQDDRAKRIQNARTEISRNLAAMDMWEEYTPKEEKRSRARVEEIMRRVELIDSPKGMEISWPAYVCSTSTPIARYYTDWLRIRTHTLAISLTTEMTGRTNMIPRSKISRITTRISPRKKTFTTRTMTSISDCGIRTRSRCTEYNCGKGTCMQCVGREYRVSQ
jgi:hypothetical protein